jgi:CHAD domain-containing protein
MAAPVPSVRAPRAIIAPDQPLADAVRTTLATGVAGMTYYEPTAIAGEIEPVHQIRVAVRRLRATVQLCAGALHGSRVRTYKRDLPWLGQAAGAVRDCDVIEALIRECGGRLDPALAGALTPLCDALAIGRRAAHAAFVEELRTKRYAQMCDRLAHPLLRRALPATAAGCSAPAMIAPIARSVRKAGKRIGGDAPPELFHRLRVRIKRLRYALEMLAEMGAKRSRKALLRLEQMQELLGMHQDVVSTTAWLRAYAADAGPVPPETLMAAGAIIQALVMRREKLAARARRRWRKIVRSGVLDDALKEVSRAAEQRLESARRAEAESARQAEAARQAAAASAAQIDADKDPDRLAVVGVGESVAQVPPQSEVPLFATKLSPENAALPPQDSSIGEVAPPPAHNEPTPAPDESRPVSSDASNPVAPAAGVAATPQPIGVTPEVNAATPEAGDVPPITPILTNG